MRNAWALILATERYDNFHMEATHDNVKVTANWFFHLCSESEELTVEDMVSRNPNPEDEHLTVEAVDPGSEMEQIVRNMIESVNLVMTDQEAEEVAQEKGSFYDCHISGPMAVDYGTDDVEEHPRGSGGPIWLTPEQLPDVKGRMGYFRLTEMECVSLGKKLSWHLRGHAKDKGFRTVEFDEEQAAEIGDVLKVISKQWSRLTVMTIIDLLTSDHCDKGHNACLLVLDSDPLKITVKQWAFDDNWTPSKTELPLTGPYPYRATAFDVMPKLAYHATYWRNFTKIVNSGLIPGGKMTSKGNSGRPFNMFALEPQWDNQGARPGAQLEFVIDLQLAACDGCRFFETKEMIWASRAYEPAQKRLAQACKDKSPNTPIYGERGHQELIDAAKACKDVYDLEFFPMSMCGLDVRIPEGHALQGSESMYQMVVHVAPRHPHHKCNDESDWRRQENVSIPSFACPACGTSNVDGTICCYRCEARLEPHSDISMALENVRQCQQGHRAQKERSAGCGPAAVRQQAAKYLGKALKAGSRTVMERQSRDPFMAYNNARFGISITGLEQLMIFARIRIANPPRSRQMIADRTGFDGAAKVSFSFPPEGEDLTLTNHCYVAFVDRFYKLDEAALLAFAVHRNGFVMEILGFSGRILKPAGPVVQILARIVGFFRTRSGMLLNVASRQLPGTKSVTERVGYADRGSPTSGGYAHEADGAKLPATRKGCPPPGRDVPESSSDAPMRPPEPKWPPPTTLVVDSTGNPIDPSQPRQFYFTRHDSLLWARLKASRDKNVPRGMEDRAVPAFNDLNDFHLLAPEHVGYYISGWKETQNGICHLDCTRAYLQTQNVASFEDGATRLIDCPCGKACHGIFRCIVWGIAKCSREEELKWSKNLVLEEIANSAGEGNTAMDVLTPTCMVPVMAPPETDKATEKELQRIRRLPENRVCPNCLKEESLGFSAVCTTFKTFICHDCKSAHQSFSHRCKSIQMSVWTLEEVKALDDCNGGGNAAAVRKYLGKVTPKDRAKQGSTLELYKRFIQRAYVDQRWADDEPEASVPEAPQVLPAPSSPETTEESKSRPRKGRHRKRREKAANLQSDSAQVAPDGLWQHDVPGQSPSPLGLEQESRYGAYGRREEHAAHAVQFFQGPGLHEHYGSNPEETHRKLLGALPRVAPQSPPLSTAGSSTVWSTPTSKGVALPLVLASSVCNRVLHSCGKTLPGTKYEVSHSCKLFHICASKESTGSSILLEHSHSQFPRRMNHEGQALQMAEAMRNGDDWPLASLGIPVSRQSRRTDTQHPDDRSACPMLIIGRQWQWGVKGMKRDEE
ncbi:AGD14 [Symbiodinium sp. CCMP2592]|nr:AGD14 [Symbiodinium sp. CCMP2592]